MQQYINNIISFISVKVNRNNDRSTNAIKNIIASFGIKGISIVVQLLLVPLTIHYVNPTQYGIWLTLSSIVGWFSFFDIGFGNGLRNRFAEAKATGDYNRAKAYVSTTYICVGVIFTIIWILFFCVNFFIDWSKILNAPVQMAHELSIVALIVISFFCLQIVLKLINTVLIADQKPAKSAFIDMLGQSFVLLTIFVLTKTTQGSLLYLALALGVCPIVIMMIFSLWFYRKDYKSYSPSIGLFDKNIITDIFILGSKFFILQFAAIIIFQSNNIIITQILNPENVTLYNVANRLFSIATMIATIIFSPFWSAFTDAYKQKDYLWMSNAYMKLFKITLWICLLVIVLFCFSPIIFKVWIGNIIHVPTSLSFIVSITVLFNILSALHYNLLNGMSKIRLQIYLVIGGIILNIPLSIFLGKLLGIEGIIVPNLIYNVIAFLLCRKQIHLLLRKKAIGIWNQ